MAGHWTKLTVTCNTKHLDDVCAVMSMLDNGLLIEDYSDFSLDGMYGALVDESILNADKEKARVSLFVPEEKNFAEYRAFLDARFSALGIPVSIASEGLEEEDYASSWKQYYKPSSVGNITVVPAWMDYEAKPGETVLRMDPGMAFGTGTHETTRLVLLLMQNEILNGKRVLDVGCGSGILSLAAVRLGASSSAAYDIDPVAVRVARDNIRNEGLSDRITADVSDLLKNVDLRGGKYGFLVANIVAEVILRMLPDLSSCLLPDAPLILSGIILSRADEIRSAAKKYGYQVTAEAVENDWIGFVLKKKSSEIPQR